MRALLPLAPALALGAYFVVGLGVFGVRVALWGVPRDEETLHRGATPILGYTVRHFFFWLIRPLWRLLLRGRVPADALTYLSLLLGLGAGVAAADGRFAVAGWVLLLSGICDVLDGRLARAQGTASPAGAAIDSILDRYSDSAILVGLAWYYRGSWVLLAVLAVFLGASVVPYVRARAEGLGVQLRGGVGQRPERVVILGVGVAFSPAVDLLLPAAAHPMHWFAVAAVVVAGVLANVTAVTRTVRLVATLRALPAPAPEIAAASPRQPVVAPRIEAKATSGRPEPAPPCARHED